MIIKTTVPQIIRKLANDHKSYGSQIIKGVFLEQSFTKIIFYVGISLKSEVTTTTCTSHTRNDIYIVYILVIVYKVYIL